MLLSSAARTQLDIKQPATDLALVLLTLFAVEYLLLQFDAMRTFAGPISLVYALAVATPLEALADAG